jgi:hypothetical protein
MKMSGLPYSRFRGLIIFSLSWARVVGAGWVLR